MAEASRSSMTRAVLIAGVLTLVLTLLRLYGELEGWDPALFNREAGGGFAPIGIAWLAPLFGIWFGARLARSGRGPASNKRAVLLPILAFALMIGMLALVAALDLQRSVAAPLVWISVPAFALLAVFAWPALAAVNLGYGLLARLPIVAITYWAMSRGWDVHHVKLGDDVPDVSADQRAFYLSMAQVTLWVPYTVMVGGVFGGLGAAVFGRRR